MMKIDAFILSYKREEFLKRVIKGVKKQSFVRDIYIVHNYPSKIKIRGVINIYLGKNFGCMARHIAAFLTDCDYAFYVDDDTEILTDLSERFLKVIKKYKGAIVGLYGCDVDRKTGRYAGEGYYVSSMCERVVDIAVGRTLLVPKDVLKVYVKDKMYLKYIHDDVILNLYNQLYLGKPSFIIPFNEKEYLNLTEKYGICLRKSHFSERTKIIRYMMKKKWKSFRNKIVYKKINSACQKKEKNFFELQNNLYERLKKEYEEGNYLKVWSILSKGAYSNSYLLCKLAYNCASVLESIDEKKAIGIYRKLAKPLFSYPNIIGLSFFKLGLIYLKKGSNKLSEKCFEKCLYFYPEHRKAKFYLGKLKKGKI